MKSETKQAVLETLWYPISIGGFLSLYYGLVFLFFLPGAGVALLPLGAACLFAAHKIDQHTGSYVQLEYKDPLLLEAEKEVDTWLEEQKV